MPSCRETRRTAGSVACGGRGSTPCAVCTRFISLRRAEPECRPCVTRMNSVAKLTSRPCLSGGSARLYSLLVRRSIGHRSRNSRERRSSLEMPALARPRPLGRVDIPSRCWGRRLSWSATASMLAASDPADLSFHRGAAPAPRRQRGQRWPTWRSSPVAELALGLGGLGACPWTPGGDDEAAAALRRRREHAGQGRPRRRRADLSSSRMWTAPTSPRATCSCSWSGRLRQERCSIVGSYCNSDDLAPPAPASLWVAQLTGSPSSSVSTSFPSTQRR